MGTVLIVLFLVVALLVGVSVALGRTSYEVESARDTEYLELDGTWVRYNVIGGGPPVLLVHGWLSSSRIWEQLAGRLAQRFTVYTLDLSGFGESDKPLSGYGIRNGSRLLYAFCANFGLTRIAVIGHNIGGDMAIKLAADHPDVVGRIVLVATPADDEQIDLPTPLWLATLPVIGPLFYTLGRLSRPVRTLWMRPFVSEPDDLTDEVIDDAGRSTPAAAAKTLSVARREISGGRLARQARIIKVPVLAISGEEDQIVDPQSVGVWARSFDQAEVCLLDGCGHLPMLERTAEFNAQVLAFLTGDARYLELVEQTVAAEEEEEYGEEPGEEGAVAGTLPDEEETGDLFTPEARGTGPNIVRRGDSRYPRRRRDTNGRDGREAPFGNGKEQRRRSSWDSTGSRGDRREPADTNPIPEIPKDLFDWAGGVSEFQPRQDPEERERKLRENRREEDDAGGPEPPRA